MCMAHISPVCFSVLIRLFVPDTIFISDSFLTLDETKVLLPLMEKGLFINELPLVVNSIVNSNLDRYN